jgi:hypothetical protein
VSNFRRRAPDLVPLKFAALDSRSAAEARAEARLIRAWGLVVGPALVRHTRLIRLRNRTLVMGCWKIEVISSLRQSLEAVWPEVQARIERLLKQKVQKVEILPCDPPEAPAPKPVAQDPLEAVLLKLRTLGKKDR